MGIAFKILYFVLVLFLVFIASGQYHVVFEFKWIFVSCALPIAYMSSYGFAPFVTANLFYSSCSNRYRHLAVVVCGWVSLGLWPPRFCARLIAKCRRLVDAACASCGCLLCSDWDSALCCGRVNVMLLSPFALDTPSWPPGRNQPVRCCRQFYCLVPPHSTAHLSEFCYNFRRAKLVKKTSGFAAPWTTTYSKMLKLEINEWHTSWKQYWLQDILAYSDMLAG